jgi:hypothetical protein
MVSHGEKGQVEEEATLPFSLEDVAATVWSDFRALHADANEFLVDDTVVFECQTDLLLRF